MPMLNVDVKYELNRLIEKLTMKFVWALPKTVVMWAYIRVIANATSGKYSDHPDDVTYSQAMQRWDEPNEFTSYKNVDGKWWAFINGKPDRMLSDDESAAVIWGSGDTLESH